MKHAIWRMYRFVLRKKLVNISSNDQIRISTIRNLYSMTTWDFLYISNLSIIFYLIFCLKKVYNQFVLFLFLKINSISMGDMPVNPYFFSTYIFFWNVDLALKWCWEAKTSWVFSLTFVDYENIPKNPGSPQHVLTSAFAKFSS